MGSRLGKAHHSLFVYNKELTRWNRMKKPLYGASDMGV